MTVLQKLEIIPPFICRLVARTDHGRRGLTHKEIATRAGLACSTVKRLSTATTWKGISVGTAEAFSAACGVNHLEAKRHKEWLRVGDWMHVSRATGAQRMLYMRLKRIMVEHARRVKSQASSQRG